MRFASCSFPSASSASPSPPRRCRRLSRSTANPDNIEFRQTLAHSLALVFLLCIPSAVGLVVLGRPIVALIFEHGKFTSFDTVQTANALAAYSLGLAGYARRQSIVAGLLRAQRCAHADAREPGLHRRELCDEHPARRPFRPRRLGVFDLRRRAGEFSCCSRCSCAAASAGSKAGASARPCCGSQRHRC